MSRRRHHRVTSQFFALLPMVFSLIAAVYIWQWFLLSPARTTPVPVSRAANSALPGDVNGDNVVNALDLTAVIRDYYPDTPANSPADINGDGRVNALDIRYVIINYLKTAPATPTSIPTSVTTPTKIPTQSPTVPPLPSPTQGPIPTRSPNTGSGIWISKNELALLPTTGAEWTSLHSAASGSWAAADISNQDSSHDIYTLAGALVCARTGEFCDKARAAVVSAINTENGGRWLAVGRNLTGYVIAADVLNLRSDGNSGSDGSRVEAWIGNFLTKTLQYNNDASRQVQFTPFGSGSNASAQEGAGYAAVAAYLGNKTALTYVWNRFRLYACDLTTPETGINIANGVAGGWTHNPSAPCAVNPKGTSKNGYRIDGAIINDMVRGGNFQWPPGYTQYPWVGLEGFVPAALLLYRAGYPALELADRAVLRSLEFLLYVRTATGNSQWFDGSRSNEIIHLVNVFYGVNLPMNGPTAGGRTVGYTGWTHPK